MRKLASLLVAFCRAPLEVVMLARCLTLMQRRDLARLDALQSRFFHPGYTVHVGGRSRISGEYLGWPAYRDAIILGEVATPARLLGALVRGGSISLFVRLTGERLGKSLDQDVVFVFRFEAGKIREQRSVPSDDAAWTRFWA